VVAELVPGQKVDRTQFHVAPEEEETHSVVRCSHPHEQHCPERRAEQVLLPRAALLSSWACSSVLCSGQFRCAAGQFRCAAGPLLSSWACSSVLCSGQFCCAAGQFRCAAGPSGCGAPVGDRGDKTQSVTMEEELAARPLAPECVLGPFVQKIDFSCKVFLCIMDCVLECDTRDRRNRTRGFCEFLLGGRPARWGQEHLERDHRARLDRRVAWLDFDACEQLSRGVGSLLANSHRARNKASLACTRRRAPASGAIEHLQHTHIHRHTHAHTHTRVTSETHAHVHTAIVYYDSLQLTSSTQKAKKKGHRAHGLNSIMLGYG